MNEQERPLNDVSNGNHDERGRFARGNKAARGNGVARKSARFRAVLYNAVSVVDFREIAARLVAEAKAGESWAVKLALEYLIGPPRDVELDERLDRLESLLTKGVDDGE